MLGAFLWFLLLVMLVVLIAAGLGWAAGGGCEIVEGCPRRHNRRCCPVYVRNPNPDDRSFALARVDGSSTGGNDCSTGFFTIQRTGPNDLLYTVTTPEGTYITDIYTLEVPHACDFPLTMDGCAVDLTAFHHQTFACDSTSNTQTFTSTITAVHNRPCVCVSILVVFSSSNTCTPLQMMTLATGKPIPLTGNCVKPACPSDTCCDPVVPNFVHVKLPRCRSPPTTV